MLSQYARRVDQLDALSLDSELFSLLNTQYRKAFLYFPSSVIAKAGPELDLLFRFLFKYLPLQCFGSTFGQNIFDLKYYDNKTLSPASKNKLRILATITVAFPWIWDKIFRRIILLVCRRDKDHDFIEASYSFEVKFLILWKLLSLFNFCVFLQKSKFSTLTERFLQIRPLYRTSQEIRVLQYDRISKELLWHGLDEFLGFTLPLINVHRIKNYFNRLWRLQYHSEIRIYTAKNEDCGICGSIPNFPHTLGCNHVFCYYCIASMILADPTFVCVECNFAANGLNSIKPVPINKPSVFS